MRRLWLILATTVFAAGHCLAANDATELKLDFGIAKTADGFVSVDNKQKYSTELGYGWVDNPPANLRDRQAPDDLLRDYVFGSGPAVFRINVAPGTYRLVMMFGDMQYGDHFIQPMLSTGGVEFPVINPAKSEFVTATAVVEIDESPLDITFQSPTNNWVLNALIIQPADTKEELKITRERVKPQPQQVCLPETDPNSPRHSLLAGDDPASSEILYTDIDEDGDPDILERWWNGKRIRWFDENDNMAKSDLHGDLADDALQIDRDDDSFYDGPGDMNVDYVDNDGDGDADLQVVAMNPTSTQSTIFANASHYMIFEDIDDDNVHGCPEWQGFDFPCWRYTGEGNFTPDYNGNSIFLKEHVPAFSIKDPRYNWENPFAFYDLDNDGVTEMTIRFTDSRQSDELNSYFYDGKLEDLFVSYDLDNDSQKDNEMDFDMTIQLSGAKADYSHAVNEFPKLKAPDWVLPYFRYTNWREIDELIYVSHDECYDFFFEAEAGNVKLTYDEDDDDHRWERVELYLPDDPYITAKWGAGVRGMAGHPQADTLGDRGEFDTDNSGKAQLYIGAWDQRIHLYGAEWGAWTVDRNAQYWGSHPVTGGSSPEKAEAVEEVVQYKDTDDNGFFDEILYDYDGDQEIDLRVSLLEYNSEGGDQIDVQPLIHAGEQRYEGMHVLFNELAESSWQSALKLYHAAWKKGLSNVELDELAIASSMHQKYQQAYFLREGILRILLERLSGDERDEVLKLYFSGRFEELSGFIESSESITLEKHL